MNFSHTVLAVSTYLSDVFMQVILVSKVLFVYFFNSNIILCRY